MNIILSALLGMVAKLLTAEFIQFCVLKGLDIVASRTENKMDDEFVAKIHEILEKK